MTYTRKEDRTHRIPGLFRPWELPSVLTPGVDYRIEPAGLTDDGCRLLAVFRLDGADRDQPT